MNPLYNQLFNLSWIKFNSFQFLDSEVKKMYTISELKKMLKIKPLIDIFV